VAYLIPTIHPAAVLRGTRPIGEAISADLGKAWRIANGDGPNLEEHIIHVVPGNPIGIESALQHALAWLESWASRPCRIGVDIETSALDYFNCKLYSIALAEAETSVAVTFTGWDLHTLPPSYEIALERALRKALAYEESEKVFHNAPFDLAVLNRRGYHVGGRYWDTQGLHHLVQPDIPHDLGWVGHTYLDVGPWKLDHESGKMANTRDPVKLLIYNAKDALYTAKLVEPMLEHISALGMSPTLAMWQAEYARLATDMENYGIPINFEKRKARGKILKDRMAQKRAWLRDFLGWPDFNPMADVHRREALYGRKYAGEPWNLCIAPTKYTKKTNKTSTSYKAIIDYLEHPFVRNLADYVESHMAYAMQFQDGTECDLNGKREKPGSYQKAICDDGRIHPRWKPNTLRTVRFGSEPNVQNQKGLSPGADIMTCDRVMFEAPPGRTFVGSDKDQLELRIHACHAGERELLAEMARPGGDPHTLACKMVYGETFMKQDEKGRKMLRTIMKNVVYASLYMAGVTTVWRTIRERKQLDAAVRAAMTMPVVSHAHSSYFMHFSQINKYNEWLVQQATTKGYIEIPPFGRRRYFPIKPVPATEVVNSKTQCCGAEIVTSEMCTIQYELKRRYHGRASIIAHKHDELNIECDERDAEDIAKLVEQIFGNTKLDGPAGPVYLTAEANISNNMATLK
jgi:DNA polymerase-1